MPQSSLGHFRAHGWIRIRAAFNVDAAAPVAHLGGELRFLLNKDFAERYC